MVAQLELENVAIANALQVEAARRQAGPFALITTPCDAKFEVAERIILLHCSVFAADTLSCAL